MSSFNPATLTVAVGTTVTWENKSGIAHTVTSATGSADTYNSIVNDGQNFSHQFTAAGTYHYYCQYHGADGSPPTGMAGTITVQ